MKKWAVCMRTWKAMLVGLLLQLFVFPLPGYASVTSWDQFSDSMNYSFSGQRSNMLALIFLVMGFVILFVIIRVYFNREEKAERLSRKAYREKREAQEKQPGQQRKWFRLKTSAEFRWIPTTMGDRVAENKFINDRMVDISGGGLCFATAELLNPGDEIEFILNTGEGKPMRLYGIVARIIEQEEDELVNHVSIQFAGLRNGERDRIVSWIMRRQRDGIHEEDEEEAEDSLPLVPLHEQVEKMQEKMENIDSPS
ncbi:MAG: PilZ domain-containing protein [Syntrophomonas sp.]